MFAAAGAGPGLHVISLHNAALFVKGQDVAIWVQKAVAIESLAMLRKAFPAEFGKFLLGQLRLSQLAIRHGHFIVQVSL